MRQLLLLILFAACGTAMAQERVPVWPELAPGESTRKFGESMPAVAGEQPPVTRVINITCPSFTVHAAAQPNGSAVIILPGGGLGKVVTDKEGTEAAQWLNQLGITAFVLSYRTKTGPDDEGWTRPVQDTQRTIALVRSRAAEWKLQPDRIGLLGFSAGGQIAARTLTHGASLAYEKFDVVDSISHRPDFLLLVYPWNMVDSKTNELIEAVRVPADCPPTFLVHTDDDKSSSLGAVHYYAGLKRQHIPAELHVYGNGGHGYGLRDVRGSQISSWPQHAAHWLKVRGY